MTITENITAIAKSFVDGSDSPVCCMNAIKKKAEYCSRGQTDDHQTESLDLYSGVAFV